jgi:CheY-like chemotaxis protein
VLLGYQKKLQMDVSVAKNGKEAVYLHLAGASFDMIIMDDLMPFMDGIEVFFSIELN